MYRNILTDSGGFQMVSLLKLANITEVRGCLSAICWSITRAFSHTHFTIKPCLGGSEVHISS
jgi:queuine/archaeosine tRNA-ribosyltransferase